MKHHIAITGFIIIAFVSGHEVAECAQLVEKRFSLYEQNELIARQRSSAPKLVRLFQNVLLPSLPDNEREVAEKVRLEFPLPKDTLIQDPLNAWADTKNHIIFIPTQTIQFFDDLCIATAWLDHHNEPQDRLCEYLAMLKYKTPKQLGLPLFPNPRAALGIPSDAMDIPAVSNIVDLVYGSTMAWLMAHELAHIVKQHKPYDAISVAEAATQEGQADEFANAFMKSIAVSPIGLITYFNARVVLEPNEHDFETNDDWWQFLRSRMTHPLSSKRIQLIGAYIDGNAALFARKEPNISVNRTRETASELSAIGRLLEDRHVQLKFQRMGRTANLTSLKAVRKRP